MVGLLNAPLGVTACYTFSRFGPEFTGPQQLASLGEIAAAGYSASELEIIIPAQVEAFLGPQREQLLDRLNELGLAVPVFAPYYCAVDLSSPDTSRREAGLRRLMDAAEISLALGCDHLQLASTLPPEMIAADSGDYANAPPAALALSSTSWARLWEFHVETIREACRRLADLGARLSIEPRVNCLVGSVDAFLRMADAVDATNLGVALDPVHALRSGDAPETAIAKCAPHLYKFEFADSTGAGLEHAPPGQGIFDWGSITKALESAGYGGPVDVDIIASPDLANASYAAAARHLRSLGFGGPAE